MLARLRRLSRLTLTTLVVAALPLVMTGCKQKTPADRLEEARSLISEQKQVPLGVLKLKELIKDFGEDPAAIEARFMLAEVYMSLGRKENFQNAFDQLKEIYTRVGLKDERGMQAHQMATRTLFEQQELEKTIEHAREGVAKSEDPATKLQMEFVLGSILLGQESEELRAEGRAFFEKASLEVEEPVMRGQARELIADYHRRKGDYAASTAVYTAYIEKYPEDEVRPQLVLAQALNYRLAGDKETFEKLFAEGSAELLKQIDAELNPETKVRMQSDLARLYEVSGKLPQAEEMLRRIMAENVGKPPAIEAQIQIGETYARTGDFEKAKALFAQISRENPGTSISRMADQYLAAIAQAEEQRAAAATAAADGETSPALNAAPEAPAAAATPAP